MRISSKNALILAPALTNGTVSLQSLKVFKGDKESLEEVLKLALQRATIPWAQSLYQTIAAKDSSVSPEPIALHDTRTVGAVYHHGTDYLIAVAGPMTATLQACDVTENERETAIRFARQQTTAGNVCYAVAYGINKHPVTKIATLEPMDKLQFIGVVVAQPVLYPNTLLHLSKIKKKYPIVHLVATGDEYYVGALAVSSKLMRPSEQLLLKNDQIPGAQSAVILLPQRDYAVQIKQPYYTHIFKDPLN